MNNTPKQKDETEVNRDLTQPVRFEDLNPGDRVLVQYNSIASDNPTLHVRTVQRVLFGLSDDKSGNYGRWSVVYDKSDQAGGWDFSDKIIGIVTTVIPPVPPKLAPKPGVWTRLDDDSVTRPDETVRVLVRANPGVVWNVCNFGSVATGCEYMVVSE